MLQLQNNTPFKPDISLLPNQDGVDTLYAVIKATFTLTPDLSVAKEQIPPCKADEYWGEPGKSSLKYGSDVHLDKLSTDVLLVGQAWAPDGRAVTGLDTGLAVAERKKMIRVHGNRVFKSGLLGLSLSAPEPFVSMPLTYERAFGGIHVLDAEKQKFLGEARNPVGRGFKGKQSSSELKDKPAPNLEDSNHPFKGPADKGEPASYGYIAGSWMPRRQYAGTYDAAWQKSRAPFLPDDFNPRFFNAAHPDLTFDRFLQGGEPVRLLNVSSHGLLQFHLPKCRFSIAVQISGRNEALEANCETVLFEPDENRLCMVWRAKYLCDKKALKIEQVSFTVEKLDGVKS
jgi:hypothetical protein